MINKADLLNFLEVVENGEGLPPQGDEHVRRYLEITRAGDEAPQGLEELATRWVEKQTGYWVEAGDLISGLNDIWPPPTREEVLLGIAVFPPWHDQEWWVVLSRYPFAEELPGALMQARAVLEQENAPEGASS